ncbi:MAG: FtsX-like permease family protein [Vicinamibacterales bacterium]
MKLRSLIAGSRAMAAAAVAALALGIGITALMFAIVDGTVRRGLPVPSAGEIVHLARVPAPGERARTVFLLSERPALEQSGSLSAIAGYTLRQTNLSGDALTPRGWDTAVVTANTFNVLGVAPAHGRAFGASIDGAAPLLISDDVWREQFGSSPAAVGRVVRANGEPAVIAGVMPPGFRFPVNHHVWALVDERVTTTPLRLWGRLAAGKRTGDAEAELTTRYQQAAIDVGSRAAAGARVTAAPFTGYILPQPVVQLLETMFFAGVGVLLIACANVANLLLARGLARRRDFAIAAALGASRARLMRERLLEGLVLAAPGAVLGVTLTYGGAALFTRALATSYPPPPYWVAIAVDGRVLAFVVVVTIISALAAAALPAWRSRSAAVSTALAEESRSTTSASLRRLTTALVIVEISLAASVLVAGGLMAKGIARLTAARFDFAVSDLVTGRVTLPARSYPTPESRRAFFVTLHERLQSVPAARGTALGSSVPFTFAEPVPFRLKQLEVDPARWPQARPVFVTPGYFDALGVKLIGGRYFEAADRLDRAPVAIVNLSFALKYAPREDLIGQTITIATTPAITATIIGVVPDLFVGNPRRDQPEAVYLALFQRSLPPDSISVLARQEAAGPALERELRNAVAAIDPHLPLDRVMTLAEIRDGLTWFYRVFGGLFLAFGLGALILALIGVYAVMSFAVTRRRREIGTRMALGATRADVARLFVMEGSWRLLVGLAAGGALAAFLTPRIALFLFQVSPRDPMVFAAAVAIVAIVGLSACVVPALRAARQDPNACLRDEG